jgi:hypothetical protein
LDFWDATIPHEGKYKGNKVQTFSMFFIDS